MLLEIHKRLQQIKAVMPDITFGGVTILAVGDLYQLLPICMSVPCVQYSVTAMPNSTTQAHCGWMNFR